MRGFVDVETFQSPHNTFTQKRISTGLVYFEQNRLFTAEVCDSRRTENHLQISCRRTVVRENLARIGRIRQITCNTERSGAGRTNSTGGCEIQSREICIHLISQRAESLLKLISKDGVVCPCWPQCQLFLTVPFDRGHFGFGDFDINGADRLVAVIWRSSPRGNINSGCRWRNRRSNSLVLRRRISFSIARYSRDKTDLFARYGIQSREDSRDQPGKRISHVYRFLGD